MLHLVHEATCSVVTDLVAALQRRGARGIAHHDKPDGLLKQRVAVLDVAHIGIAATSLILADVLGQQVGFLVADVTVVVLLLLDEVTDAHDVRSIDKRALQSGQLAVNLEQHVTASDELLGSRAVDDDLTVDALGNGKGDAPREVTLNQTRDDLGRRALGGDNHVDTHCTRFLSNAHQRRFHLLASGHDHVAELVDNAHDIRHILIFLLAVFVAHFTQLAAPHIVVIAHVAHPHFLKHPVAVFHLLYQAVQGLDDAVGVGDDGFFLTGCLGKVVFL